MTDTNLNHLIADKSISSMLPVLKAYAWFSLICITVPQLVKAGWRYRQGGLTGLTDNYMRSGLSHADAVHNAVIGYSFVLIFIAVWVWGVLILLRTNDIHRVHAALNWFLAASVCLVILNAFGKDDWKGITVDGVLAVATLGIIFVTHKGQQTNPVSRLQQMTNLERRRAIVTSGPIMFLMFTVPFGIIESLPNRSNHHHFSLANALATGLPFGIIMTILSRRRLRKFNQTTGVSGASQQWAMHDAVRAGKLPEQPEIRAAFPAYLETRIQANRRARIYSTNFFIIIGVLQLLTAIVTKDVLLYIAAILFAGLAVVNHITTRVQAEKLAQLKSKLNTISTRP